MGKVASKEQVFNASQPFDSSSSDKSLADGIDCKRYDSQSLSGANREPTVAIEDSIGVRKSLQLLDNQQVNTYYGESYEKTRELTFRKSHNNRNSSNCCNSDGVETTSTLDDLLAVCCSNQCDNCLPASTTQKEARLLMSIEEECQQEDVIGRTCCAPQRRRCRPSRDRLMGLPGVGCLCFNHTTAADEFPLNEANRNSSNVNRDNDNDDDNDDDLEHVQNRAIMPKRAATKGERIRQQRPSDRDREQAATDAREESSLSLSLDKRQQQVAYRQGEGRQIEHSALTFTKRRLAQLQLQQQQLQLQRQPPAPTQSLGKRASDEGSNVAIRPDTSRSAVTELSIACDNNYYHNDADEVDVVRRPHGDQLATSSTNTDTFVGINNNQAPAEQKDKTNNTSTHIQFNSPTTTTRSAATTTTTGNNNSDSNNGNCGDNNNNSNSTTILRNNPNTWNGISIKYGRMSRRGQRLMAGNGNGGSGGSATDCDGGRPAVSPRAHKRTSCICLLIGTLLKQIFPILDTFNNYDFRKDLFNEICAGVTMAIMHIPQGMAYGLLAGVDPIDGLKVSFVPVLMMAFMSRSRHVSYGTFAVISMLLVNCIDSVKLAFKQQQQQRYQSIPIGSQQQQQENASTPSQQQAALVVTNNHQPLDQAQQLLRSLLQQTSTNSQPLDESYQLTLNDTTSSLSSLQNLVKSGDSNSFLSLVDSSEPSAGLLPLTEMPTNIEILTCVCLVCGIIHITMSLMRLGVLSLMFSDQLVSSFTTASAFHVLTSQLAGLFDLNLAPIYEEMFKLFKIWWQFGRALIMSINYGGDGDSSSSPEPTINQMTGLLSLASIMFLLVLKELIEPMIRRKFTAFKCLPSELFLMVIVTFSSWYWSLSGTYNIRIIGQVPSGLPAPQVPRLDLIPLIIQDSITVALLSFAMNLSLAQVYAKRYKYKLDPNQELFALGNANVIGAFFGCFPCGSSLSRSAVHSNFNVRSQLSVLISCSIVVLIICYFTSVLYDLPRSTLSCIIVVALKGVLLQVREFYDNWRLSKLDALVWLTTFVAVITFGVMYGLIVGIVASLFMIFLRLLTPNHSLLGQLPGTDIYVDLDAFADCRPVDGVRIFRFNSALCYLNRQVLKSRIEKLLPHVYPPQGFHALCCQLYQNHHQQQHQQRHHPPSGKQHLWPTDGRHGAGNGAGEPPLCEYLIIDCSALAYCDCSGVQTLIEIIEELEEQGLQVYLAACPLKLIDVMERMGRAKLMERNIYPTISEAVGRAKYLQSLAANGGEQRPMSTTMTTTTATTTTGDKSQCRHLDEVTTSGN